MYWEFVEDQETIINNRMEDFGEKLYTFTQAAVRDDITEKTFGMEAILSGMQEEYVANQASPQDAAMTALTLEYLKPKSRKLDYVPPVDTAQFYLNAPYEYVSRFFSPLVRSRLDDYFGNGTPLDSETVNELGRIWRTMGSPGGDFNGWLRQWLRQQWGQGSTLQPGMAPAAY